VGVSLDLHASMCVCYDLCSEKQIMNLPNFSRGGYILGPLDRLVFLYFSACSHKIVPRMHVIVEFMFFLRLSYIFLLDKWIVKP
jgi:hypothetical protein